MKKLQLLESLAVRVMYFFNVTDTFLPFSILVLFVFQYSGFPVGFGLLPEFMLNGFSVGASVFLYACLKIAEFHVLYFAFFPVLIPLFLFQSAFAPVEFFNLFLFFFALTSGIQIVFMALPNAYAARSPAVILRVFLNSFVILAPTTLSLPVTIGFQLFTAATAGSLGVNPTSSLTLATAVALLVSALLVRRFKKKGFIPLVYHPENAKALYKRVIVLNLDGVSHTVFSKAEAPFLHHLKENFLHAGQGASTVYKAFTNPAFASILSGATPEKHKVINNNLGQPIKAEALPDFIETRLYGSMHVDHFSKPTWQRRIVSLVVEGYDRADEVMMEQLKEDLLCHSSTELWIADLSLADFCGHGWGAYSKKHYDAVKKLDSLIKNFFIWCEKQNLLEETLFVICADHGMFIAEHAYLLNRREEFVPLIFVGKTVAKEQLIMPVSILDIAANISYALGKRYCRESVGRVFDQSLNCPAQAAVAKRAGLL